MSLAPIATLPSAPSGRFATRLDAREEVWVYWGCNGRDDVSRVRDLSSGGLFLETPRAIPAAALANLHFLVGEGQIRAEGVVRHVKPECGLGLKFTTVTKEDRPKLYALLDRLISLSRSPH
jgi:hypothetical protein